MIRFPSYNSSANVLHSFESGSVPTREKIDPKYKWDLTHVYSSDQEWEKEFKSVENKIPNYKKFEGRLHESPEILLACLNFDDELGKSLEKLHLYAMLSKDSDMRNPVYQAMDDRVRSLYSKVSAASSFIKPELVKMEDNQLRNMIRSNDQLRVYNHFIDDLIRTKSHTLSPGEEQILALSSEVTQLPYTTYSIFTNADFIFPVVKDDRQNDTEITHARFYAAMYSPDREYRQRAFKAYFKPYGDYLNTLTSLFNGNLKTNIFYAKARKYKSAREASLDKNNIPVSVYDNLVESANKNVSPLHRWASVKKRLLKLDQLHPYDVYVTIFDPGSEKKYKYEEAQQLVLNSLKPLGEDYLSSVRMAFNNRWIDVYETKAKRSGAYSSGTTFGVHPYVLLNWTDLLNDVFTLAHEMGHNMHSYYTGISQPFPYANYSIFLAEVASTFNESLLLDYMIDNAASRNEKLFLLEKYLNNITATFYRQIMFAEFEMIVYDKTEKGESLTQDYLKEIYTEIYKKYWGTEMVVDDEERITWARIPHFYYNFYVFQYATGFAASEFLTNKVKTEGKPAVESYLGFLKAGSSDYPLNILKKAGVDMNSPEPVLATTRKMNELLDEIESIL
ncbi:MAG: oligoendopeptidase F [Ignavibacteriaceae bacterium]